MFFGIKNIFFCKKKPLIANIYIAFASIFLQNTDTALYSFDLHRMIAEIMGMHVV